jgi:hypothetical protein
MEKTINNKKKLLLIMPDFQDIYKMVIQELIILGYDVIYVRLPVLRQAIHRTNPVANYFEGIFNKLLDINKDGKIKKIAESNIFDIIFAIGGFFFSPRILSLAKKRNPLLKSIVFYWDSFNIWDYTKTIEYFDKKFSFDKEDCNKYAYKQLHYFPNFYLTPTKPKSFPQYNICHIGSILNKSVSRLHVVSTLKEDADKKGLTSYMRLYLPVERRSLFQWLAHIFRYLTKSQYRNFIYKKKCSVKEGIITSQKLTLDECYDIESNSKCIIDVPIDGQHGHTIRALNAIASGQKLITTDVALQYEPFFHHNNICIIDTKKPNISKEFLDSPMIDVDISYLKLNNWLKYIINGEK